MVLPQGAQTAITVVDANREPIELVMAQAGSKAVALTLPENGRAVLVSANLPGFADILLLPKDGDEDGEKRVGMRRPLALSVRVVPARERQKGDGPLTLELTLPAVEGEQSAALADDVSVMLTGKALPGWTEGYRTVGAKPYQHWVREGVERARVPTG